jgi:GntR family transcriptional regulator, transcriptional repressor for pyruvate dehydrogenase complex
MGIISGSADSEGVGHVSNLIRPKKTALILAQRIVKDIDRQGLGRGDKLPAEKLMMESYGAGRGTLRESLRYLELQGVLSFKQGPGGGPVVEKPTADNLATTLTLLLQFEHAPCRVMVDARAAFEPVMAQLAAERIGAEGLTCLEQSLTEMEADIDGTEPFVAANAEFHNTIAWSSGNPLFGFLIEAMVGAMDLSGASHDAADTTRRRQVVLAAHREIFEAIKSGDRTLAGESMSKHIEEYVTYAQRKFPQALSQPITWD